ncbi:hypothetical protein [Pontibacter flavimaris]|uniref:Nucleotide-diphospho-sugar transferase domain-containing protein n=1 Tax=Pontibacter flavimaris TaxID=1797110 RepID=A0A1Q5PB71_9BACT|nr:hypothetical protein [Pontibacter flavimaris]OKL39454.1 hypothetical protein A3841_02520 [Pontibacter flavimaris]
MEVKDSIVFLAMGEVYARQAVYAILSLLKVYRMRLPESLRIIIYTNAPEYFSSLEDISCLDVVYLNEEKFCAWKGAGNQLFRTKIKLLQEVRETVEGNILYADTDIVFFKRIDHLFHLLNQGNCILHTKEAALSTAGFDAYRTSFCGRHLTLTSGWSIYISDRHYMWNAGVIGLSPEKYKLVDDVLELNDRLLLVNNLRLVEQLAFSVVLAETCDVMECHNRIFHYCWNDGKDKMDEQIKRLLKDTEGERIERKVLRMNQYRIYYPSTKDKLLYFSRPRNLLAMLKRKFLLLQNNH